MSKEAFFEEVDDPNIPYYIFYATIQGFKTSVHKHNKGQLLYAEGGIVHVFVNDRHWYLPARCYMWIPPNLEHSIMSYSKKTTLYNYYFETEENESPFYQSINIYFTAELLRELFMYLKKWHGPIKSIDAIPYHFLKSIKTAIPDFEENKLPFAVQHPFPKDEMLLQIGAFLLDNIDKSYTITEIAKRFGISERTLSRKFQVHLGINYVRFSRSLRITKALELIAEGKYNMLEIALMVGYNSIASFSNIFIKVVGMRPTDYAKLLQ